MTERNTEKTYQLKQKHVKNAGIGATLILASALVGAGLTGGFKGSESTYNPSPSATELATPTTSEAAGTPEPSSEVEVLNFTVEKLGTFEVLPGDIIAGDISMSDTKDSAIFPLYDQDTHKAADVEDNTKTALYVEVQAPGFVHAEWGATVTRGLTAEQKAEMLKLQAISKERGGFDKVDVVIWTGYTTTVDQAGSKADGEGSLTPNVNNPTENGTNLDGLSNQDKLRIVLNLFAEGKVDPNSAEGKVLMDILVNCLCNCSTPTESPKPEVCVNPSFKDHLMKPGETYKVPAGVDFIAQGDVKIDGKTTYDSNEKTGAISVVTDEKSNTIYAPWGADIQVFDCTTDAFVNETYKHDLEQLLATNRSLDKNSINQLK